MTNPNPLRHLLAKFGPAAGFALVLILFAGTVWALVEKLMPAGAAIQQPIQFNHHVHVSGKDGIKCTTCHKYVDKDIFASLPQVDTCMDCHQIVMRMSPTKLDKKPLFKPLKQYMVKWRETQERKAAEAKAAGVSASLESASTADPGYIPWKRIYRQPDYVFFSHRRHVVIGKVECKSCHGDMSELTSPLPRPVVNQSMTWCMNCHEQKQASLDCIACHK